MVPGMEEVRRELAASSSGVGFLIGLMEEVAKQAGSAPYLSWSSAILILACCGFGDELARECIRLNTMNMRVARGESGKFGTKQKSGFEGRRKAILAGRKMREK